MYNSIPNRADVVLDISDSGSSNEDESKQSETETCSRSIQSERVRTISSSTTQTDGYVSRSKTYSAGSIKVALTREGRRKQRLNSKLLRAVENGNMSSFNSCVVQGAHLDAACRKNGLTACHLAAFFGRLEMLSALLSKGANSLQPAWYDGCLPLHLAAWKGDVSILQVLLSSNPESVEIQSKKCNKRWNVGIENLDSWNHNHEDTASKIPSIPFGSTALHVACRRMKVDCVLFLLENGADVKITDDRGLTAICVINEDVELEEETSEDQSLVIVSSDEADSKSSVAKLEDTVDITGKKTDENFVTLKIKRSAAEQVEIEKRSKSHKKRDSIGIIVNSLIEHGATFEMPDTGCDTGDTVCPARSATLLHTAVLSQDSKLIEQLVSKGACVFTRNSEGDSPIHLATRRRLLVSLETLLKYYHKSDLDVRDAMDRTPLLLAIEESWMFGISLLLEIGASVFVKDKEQNSVLHYAAKGGNMIILEELLTLQEIFQVIDWKNTDAETALMIAARCGNTECVRLLLEFGANTRLSSSSNITVVHIAAEKGYLEILELVLTNDIDLKDAKTDEGLTALHISASRGHLHCVQYLLSVGSDTLAKSAASYFGGTALHFAARNGHLPVVECLISHNRQLVNIVNADNWYPLHVAAAFGHKECVECIVKSNGDLSDLVPDSEGNKKSVVDLITYTIPEPVLFLQQIFDSYVDISDMPLNHPKCVITFDYSILMPSGENKKQMKVLNAFLNNESIPLQQTVLLHPLIETFMYLKWRKLRVFFTAIVILYIIFTAALTSFALSLHVWKMPTMQIVSGCIMLITLLVLSLQEILHASNFERYYVTDLESLLKWSTFITALVVGITGFVMEFHDSNVEEGPKEISKHTYWQDVAAVSVLLSWLELLFLLSRFPGWGFYVLMFFRVASNVVKVFSTFACLMLGFVFSFYILFRTEPPFTSFWETLVKVIVMTSELEYSAIFEQIDKGSLTFYLGRLVFLMFVVLVGIVLMNLMIGLAVNDISLLEEEGKSRTLAKQIDFMNLLEMFVYHKKLIRYLPEPVRYRLKAYRAVPRQFKIHPGRPLCPITRKLPSKLKDAIREKILAMQNAKREKKAAKRRLSTSLTLPSTSVAEQPKLEVLEKLKNIANELESIKYRLSYLRNV